MGGVILLAACNERPFAPANYEGLDKPRATATPAAEKTDSGKTATRLDDDIEYIQKANFTFVFVFRRKDGAAFDAGDTMFLKTNSPPETNQWLVSDAGKAVIAGSNYAFAPEQIKELKTRYALQDMSPPQPDDGNAANAQKAAPEKQKSN